MQESLMMQRTWHADFEGSHCECEQEAKDRNSNSEPETAHLAGSKVMGSLILKPKLTSWETQTKLKHGAGEEKPLNSNY